MKKRVAIASASPFLALVIRKTLARSRHLEPPTDQRDAASALAALRASASLAVVDAELLHAGADGAALGKELRMRRGPSVVIDARGSGVPDDVAGTPSVVVIRGRHGRELDVGVVETELLAAVGSALRGRGSRGGEVDETPPPPRTEAYDAALDLIVLGVSTGGPPLLLQLLAQLTPPAVPILIVQHMPESETAGFADRLRESTGLLVREVAAGPLPLPGTLGVLRGGSDFRIARRGSILSVRAAEVAGNPFHPSVDAILSSAVEANVAVGAVILTGMGHDGASGALAMARKGLPVIAQRPDTCAVAGMPQAAIDNGAARWVLPPDGIATALNSWSNAARNRAQGGDPKCLP